MPIYNILYVINYISYDINMINEINLTVSPILRYFHLIIPGERYISPAILQEVR